MYTLHSEQYVTSTPSEAWDFLKNPANLNLITPEDLHFQIVSQVPEVMFNGLIIEYLIKIPWLGVRKWVAEIKHIKEMHSFVDEQRIGPFRFWYHYHQIDNEGDRLKLIDKVYYEVPYGIIGKCIHFIFIRKNLERIFHYRKEKLTEILGKGR